MKPESWKNPASGPPAPACSTKPSTASLKCIITFNVPHMKSMNATVAKGHRTGPGLGARLLRTRALNVKKDVVKKRP